MSEDTEDANEDVFTMKLMELCDANTTKKKPWDRAKVNEVIKELTEVKYLGNAKKTSKQYYLQRQYQVVDLEGVQQVICKPKTESDPMVIVLPIEDYYKTLLEVHRSVGHGGRDKMISVLRTRCYIPRSVIDVFLTCCNTCNVKKISRRFVLRPITSSDFNIRAQVDIIDLSNTPDKQYKYLISHHDHFTRFCNLRPLISKDVDEVANELLKIFLEFGVPRILQSESGRDFAALLVEHLATLYPDYKIVHGSHERTSTTSTNQISTINDVEEQLKTWMIENKSSHWSLGCYHVQWQRNNTLNGDIGGAMTPYKALFGREPTNGLTSLTPPEGMNPDAFNNISTEEELEAILENKADKKIAFKDKQAQVESNTNSDKSTQVNDVNEAVETIVCNVETIGSHTCSKCQRFVHFMCGEVTPDVPQFGVLCTLCQRDSKTGIGAVMGYKWVDQ